MVNKLHESLRAVTLVMPSTLKKILGFRFISKQQCTLPVVIRYGKLRFAGLVDSGIFRLLVEKSASSIYTCSVGSLIYLVLIFFIAGSSHLS